MAFPVEGATLELTDGTPVKVITIDPVSGEALVRHADGRQQRVPLAEISADDRRHSIDDVDLDLFIEEASATAEGLPGRPSGTSAAGADRTVSYVTEAAPEPVPAAEATRTAHADAQPDPQPVAVEATPGRGPQLALVAGLLGAVSGLVALFAILTQENDDLASLRDDQNRLTQRLDTQRERLARMQESLPTMSSATTVTVLEEKLEATRKELGQLRDEHGSVLERLDQAVGELAPSAKPPTIAVEPIAVPAPAAPHVPTATAVTEKPTATGWSVVIASVATPSQAKRLRQEWEKRGRQAAVHGATIKGRQWYRVAIGNFRSRSAAEAARKDLVADHGITGTWLMKR